MGDEVKIDKDIFQTRLGRLVSSWKADKLKAGEGGFNGANSIIILLGKSDDSSYQKNNSMHFWLLGYEFPATLMILTQDGLHVVTTAKKAKHLEPLTGGKIPLVLHIRGKDADANKKSWEECIEVIKAKGKKVGVLPKSEPTGPFADEWKEVLKNSGVEIEEVDITQALSTVFLSKDEHELRAVRSAAKACTALMQDCFFEEMSVVLDEEKKVSHEKLAKNVDSKIDDPKFFTNAKLKMPPGFTADNLDWVYGPVVQSGGKFDLKLGAVPDQNNLHAGVIIAGIGLRYRQYCSMLARTFLVNPTKSCESNYKFLLAIHEAVLKECREGVTGKDLYNKAIGMIRAKKPDLEKHFLKNVGGGIGIELRDNNMLLNAKNNKTIKDGYTFTIMTGFTDVPNPEARDKADKVYSLYLADTIRVKKGEETAIFTSASPRDLDSTSFFFKDEDDEKPQTPVKKANKKDSKIGAVAATNITKSRLRAERTTQVDEGAELKRKSHQKELAQKKQSEGLAKYTKGTGSIDGVQEKKFKRFESYKRDNQLPSKVKELAICVDERASSVILPIMGRPVPFHINTIKNASASEEGDFAFLRINFLSPGQGVGRKDDQPFEDANAHFVRSLTFRSADRSRMSTIADQITNLRKEITKKENAKKEFEDVVEQDKLIEIRNRKPQRLEGVYVRPALEGKRIAGEVEIHQNGVLYRDGRGSRVEVLFSNTKHLFFQPCQGELIVIIHFHLKNPIVIGKRKTRDVQFIREATDMQFDETGNRKRRHRMGDEEEFEMEQEERRRRAALDKEFKAFAERIQTAAHSIDEDQSVDVPFRDLGFNGVPFRSNVLMQPTTDCLVQLTEPPFTVLTLDEIEVAHLERVQFGLKNFDMVFVYKDYNKPVTHVNTIPVESLEAVKDWLDSCNIQYTDGPLNLNWSQIMKTVTADPHQFYVDGGWSFLAADSDEEEGDEEDEESAFEISDGSLAQSDEESEDESDFDDDASADASEEDDSEDEPGEDWDELEAKAARKDRDSGLNDEETSGRKRKR